MSGRSVRVVNVVPRGRSKYALEKNNFQNNGFSEQEEKQKTKAILSSMKPGSFTSLASENVNCIIIKTEDDCEPPTIEEKRLELVKVDKPIKEVGKKQQEVQPVMGPFQCLQDGCCQRIFFSCCEYLTHYWDEHMRRRKGLRCQVCEKPLSLDVDEQHPYACDAAIPDGGSSEEIAAEALSDSQGLNAKHRHDGLVEASAEIHEGNNKWSQLVDAADSNASNWCQYQGQIDYRTIIKIPRFTELRFYGGSESARLLDVNLKHYNSPSGYAHKFGATVQKKRKLSPDTGNGVNQTSQATEEGKTNYEDIEKTSPQNTDLKTVFTKTINSIEDSTMKNANIGYDQNKQEKCIIVKKNISNKQKRINTYICDVCKINFNSKHMLECHMNSHTVLRQKHTLDIKPKKIDVNIVKNNEQILKGEVCNFCNKSFVRKRDFTRHIRTHTGEKPYKCNVYNKYFAQKCNLTTHIRSHTGENPYQCNVCNKDFSQKYGLTRHIRSHTGEKPYQCNVCNKDFSQKYGLIRHIRSHTGEKPYQCNVCNKYFACKNNLSSHTSTHTGEKPYQCNVCNKYFAQKGSLTTHIKSHTGAKPYQCNVCNKYFAHKRRLSSHIRTHTGEKPYQCNVCNKDFAQKTQLILHLSTHMGEKSYQCNVCNKDFSQKCNLTRHIRSHTGEKPYQCNVCNKDFSQKYGLIRHIRSHTGEKPYQCNVCNKYFACKNNLSSHTSINTGEKPYQCNVCNKDFARQIHLILHLRTHTGEKPYQCNVCNKYFAHKASLTTHIRTHTGEKPYQCNVCNKDFARKTYLILHIRTHTGEKPYQCNVCNKYFAQKSYLTSHIRTHKGEKPY